MFREIDMHNSPLSRCQQDNHDNYIYLKNLNESVLTYQNIINDKNY